MGSKDNETDIHNGAILNNAQVQKVVLASAVEAEVGALFING